MKKFILLVALISAPLGACANPDYASHPKPEIEAKECEIFFEKLGVCSKIVWVNAPAKKQDSKFQLVLTGVSDEESIEKLAQANLDVELWMPSMGHGSSPTTVQKINAVTYDVSNVHFIMGGDWEIRFTLKKGSEILDEAIFKINI